MNRITLYRGGNCWLAQFSGPHAMEIRRLFDTDTLPTPFSEAATPNVVLAAIERANPDMQVEIRAGWGGH